MNEIEAALIWYDGNNRVRYCDLVYKALKDMQRRQKGCKYCLEKVCLEHDQDNDGIKISNCADLWCITSDTWEFEIEYCPICGREL